MPERARRARKTTKALAPKAAASRASAKTDVAAPKPAASRPAAPKPAAPKPAAPPAVSKAGAQVCPRCGTEKFGPEERTRIEGRRTVRYTIFVCERGHTFARPRRTA